MLMYKNTILILFALISFFACSITKKLKSNDYFEGKITYNISYKFNTVSTSKPRMNKVFGEKSELFFKEGNYLEIYDGIFMSKQLYNKQDNKIYIEKSNKDTLYWTDCGQPGEKILRTEINHKKETILGIVCDELVVNYDFKTISYYFNSDSLSLDPDWFDPFTLTNKNLISQQMKAVYLKCKIEYADLSLSLTATSIVRQPIADQLFSVPEIMVLVEDK